MVALRHRLFLRSLCRVTWRCLTEKFISSGGMKRSGDERTRATVAINNKTADTMFCGIREANARAARTLKFVPHHPTHILT